MNSEMLSRGGEITSISTEEMFIEESYVDFQAVEQQWLPLAEIS